jgi:hypothetical protein
MYCVVDEVLRRSLLEPYGVNNRPWRLRMHRSSIYVVVFGATDTSTDTSDLGCCIVRQ